MDKKILSALDLNSTEVAVYEAVLARGSITPTALAKAAGVKRTTAYSIARGLVDKGLLEEDATRRPRTFSSSTPESIRALIEQDKRRLQERELLFARLADEVAKNTASATYPVPTVRFVEEHKIKEFLFQQDSVWDQSILDNGEDTWWGFQDHTFVEHYGDWILEYWERAPKNIWVRLISNRAPVELAFSKQRIRKREIKFWGEATNFESTTWVVGDYVVMTNTRARPFYLVEIHDKRMAHDQREVFRNLWPLIP